MELLIGSVIGYRKYLNAQLLDLQQEFIKKNTKGYHHVVFLNCPASKNFPEIIGINEQKETDPIIEHLRGLLALMDYFKETPSQYYLILDTDCFPIREDWLERVEKFPIAAILRPENLETGPHASALFFHREALDKIVIHRRLKKNIIGQTFNDIEVKADEYFPLLRTNFVNPHHLWAGIYFDTFYHHGAGSRISKTRTTDYYTTPTEEERQHKSLLESLFKNPEGFIAYLRG